MQVYAQKESTWRVIKVKKKEKQELSAGKKLTDNITVSYSILTQWSAQKN